MSQLCNTAELLYRMYIRHYGNIQRAGHFHRYCSTPLPGYRSEVHTFSKPQVHLLISRLGISEYFFFLFAVFGIYIIRRRQTERGQASLSYRTWTGNPIIFTVASAFVVTRGVITDYIQGIILVTVMGIGWITFRIKFRREEQARGTAIHLTS